MSYLIEKLINIDNEIRKCDQCLEYVEKFTNFSSISFGTSTDLLIVGESPEKNGWRMSGVVWHNADNKITYSGKKMQKLLENFDINLLETYFLEAIKCYPISKKYLNFCNHYCEKFLKIQIEVLSPKVVLLLGEYATRAALNVEDFNKMVGLHFKKIINEKEILFIPIYNPKSIHFKRNIKILKELKSLLKFKEEQNDSFALQRTI